LKGTSGFVVRNQYDGIEPEAGKAIALPEARGASADNLNTQKIGGKELKI
jgi:hypothetical protein